MTDGLHANKPQTTSDTVTTMMKARWLKKHLWNKAHAEDDLCAVFNFDESVW